MGRLPPGRKPGRPESGTTGVGKKKITVLLVEDNRMLHDEIAHMLKEHKDITVVASARTAVETMKRMAAFKPGVLLLDVELTGQNSLQLVATVGKKYPATKVIVMDLIPSQDVVGFVQAGVSGFLMKEATMEDFLATIRKVADGASILPPNLTGSLFSRIIEPAAAGADRSGIRQSVMLTRRERQVIQLVADGMSNKEIADKLHLSPATVKSHIHKILEKLALQSRIQIANYAHTSENFRAAADSVTLIDDE